MFSPNRVTMVLMPAGFKAAAAAIASSTASPGINFFTERRTNAVRTAFSRIQALVEAHNKALRIRDILFLVSNKRGGCKKRGIQKSGLVQESNVRSGVQESGPAFKRPVRSIERPVRGIERSVRGIERSVRVSSVRNGVS